MREGDQNPRLTSAYADLYSAAGCAELTKALQAVELDQPGTCSGIPGTAPACAVDICHDDPDKLTRGVCGCGAPDTNVDDPGFASLADCDGQDPDRYPGNNEICDAKDNDCNGLVDNIPSALDCNVNVTADECEVIASHDFNNDGEVNLTDIGSLADYAGGPGADPSPSTAACAPACLQGFDTDEDGDVDLPYYSAFGLQFLRQ